MKTRFKPEARKHEIVQAALALAAAGTHYTRISRDDIGATVGVTGAAVQYHFRTVKQLHRDIIRAAVAAECLPVIAQGLAALDPHAAKADPQLKRRALETLT